MYRKIIDNGDLVVTYKPWWGFGKEYPYRNLSEEVRCAEELVKAAESKYYELHHRYVIASTNVAEELETLQALLLDNSSAYFTSDLDISILEKRDGIKYNYRSGNNKKDSSSNKDNQQKQQQKNQSGNSKQDKSISLADILLKGKVTLH
ncbi:MAG: hypothetical protein JSW41_04895 [Candidatus Aenigmatarchaeota archaeon]|nr:MAG: hypothetical protein JSW41_04895 [Candidatus Aenigmarchaeota archaeon]